MPSRERKLLIIFATVGFIILNFLGVGKYFAAKQKAELDLTKAEAKLAENRLLFAEREELAPEIEWLAAHEPRPASQQSVQTNLQKLVSDQATRFALVSKPGAIKFLPVEENPQNEYSRARIQITCTGTEENLYRWISEVNDPDKLIAVTQMKLSPTKDDYQIDCTAVVEQWFVADTNPT